MRRVILASLLVGYLALLFHLTLFRFYHLGSEVNLVPFRTIRKDYQLLGSEFVVNTLGNLVAFTPMGVLPPLLLGPRRTTAFRVAGMSFGLSLLIEVLQWISKCRVADVDDLILNTVGGLIGFGMLVAVGWIRKRTGRRRPADEPA